MVNINLKEIFSIDNQSDLASKLNFNFNQLLALGVGQPGATGETGQQGEAGPTGPIGPQGEHGSTIYESGTSAIFETLVTDPTAALVGDYFIDDTKIYKKTADWATSGQWNVITNFTDIASNLLSASTSGWQTGIQLSATSRNLVPVRNSGKTDRITVNGGSSGGWATQYPNWQETATAYWNSQILGYNFDPQTVKTFTDGTSGLNSYDVNITTSRLGSGVGDEAFPYSAIATFYSYFVSGDAETEADQFTLTTGHRHQVEIGSVDDILETIVSNDTSGRYVVSPTWQNLRIRKFRSTSGSVPGGALVHADFNLHSDDDALRPALNSRFTWRINKKLNATAGEGDNIILSLSSKKFEESAVDKTGIAVDGIHLRSTSDPGYAIAFGIDPNNNGTTINNAIISSGTSGNINSVVFDGLAVKVNSGSTSVKYDHTGVIATKPLLVKSGGGSNNDVTLQSGTSGSDGGWVNVVATNTTNGIILGNSTSNRSSGTWTSSSGYAIRIKGNRLASGLPFAYSAGALPTYSSADPNVLDEYQEGTFTPSIVYTDTLPTPGEGAAGTSALSANTPTFGDQSGTFTKIGNVVNFSLQFSISNWKALKPTNYAVPETAAIAYASTGAVNEYSTVDYGNIYGTSTPAAVKYGSEPYQIRVRGIMDHWPADPDVTPKFSISLKTESAFTEAIRSTPFTFRYGGTGTGSAAGATMWNTLEPSSLYAQFGTWDDGGTTRPHLELWGFRNRYPRGSQLYGWYYTHGIPSRVSVYDFLRRRTSAASDKVFINISGTYVTTHQTADQANWSQYDPEPVDDGTISQL